MDEGAIERARRRLARVAEGRTDPADVESALERARAGIEALAETTAKLEATLPGRVDEAVQQGLREQVLPVGRHLAEVRGLTAQAIRRLERLEGELLAERHGRIEKSLEAGGGAVVYRMEERRGGSADTG